MHWNSFFDAMDKTKGVLDNMPNDTVTQLFQALDVATFFANKFILVHEYCFIIQPHWHLPLH
jgi:hypothetical protein